jgi:hypothetical protein
MAKHDRASSADSDIEDVKALDALETSVKHYSTRNDNMSKAYLEQFDLKTNPRSLRGEKAQLWVSRQGKRFSVTFPALLYPSGQFVKLDPYFSLSTNTAVCTL